MIVIELQILICTIIICFSIWYIVSKLLGSKIGKAFKKESKKIVAKIKEEDENE